MKQVLMIGLLLTGLAMTAGANCGNDKGTGNGCSEDDGGKQGPVGPQGPAGQNGSNGVNGSNGIIGPAANSRAAFILGAQVRLFDTRYVSLFAFDDFQADPMPRHQVLGGDAKNNAYGARIVFKLGPDYTEERIEALNRKLKALEHKLDALQQ